MSSKEEIHQKMSEYSTFIDKVLRPELETSKSASQKVKDEIDEYNELRNRLRNLKKEDTPEVQSIVDLGYKTVFCRAVAQDAQKVFVHVGMGFHVEFTLPEAIEFTTKRIHYLQDDVLADKDKKVREVQEHIASAGIILEQLERELRQ